MKILWLKTSSYRKTFRQAVVLVAYLAVATPAFAQANSPWENAVGVLQQAFTSTIARGLSLIAIVVSGLTSAFGEGGSKRVLAGDASRLRRVLDEREITARILTL
jgi:type IV secretory pathway VirB2 component (pilin)